MPDPVMTKASRITTAARGIDPHYTIGVLAYCIATGATVDKAIEALNDTADTWRAAS